MEGFIDTLDSTNRDCLDAFETKREQDLAGLLQELRTLCRIVAKGFSICSDSQKWHYGRYMNREKPFARAAWLYFSEHVTLFRDLSTPITWNDKLVPRDHVQTEISVFFEGKQASSSVPNRLKEVKPPIRNEGPHDDQKFRIALENCTQHDPVISVTGKSLDEDSKAIDEAPLEGSESVEAATGHSGTPHLFERARGDGPKGREEELLEVDHPGKNLINIAADDQATPRLAKGNASGKPGAINPSISGHLPLAAIGPVSDVQSQAFSVFPVALTVPTEASCLHPQSPPPFTEQNPPSEILSRGSSIQIEVQPPPSPEVSNSELPELWPRTPNSNTNDALEPFMETSTGVSNTVAVELHKPVMVDSPLMTMSSSNLLFSPPLDSTATQMQDKLDDSLNPSTIIPADGVEVSKPLTVPSPLVINETTTLGQSLEVKSKATICWIPVEEITLSGSCKRCVDKQEACKISYDLIRDKSGHMKRKITRGVCNNCQTSHLRCYWNDEYFKPCPKKGHIHISLAKSPEAKIWCESPAAMDEEQQLLQSANVSSNLHPLNDKEVEAELSAGAVSSSEEQNNPDMSNEGLSEPHLTDAPRMGCSSGAGKEPVLQRANECRKRSRSMSPQSPRQQSPLLEVAPAIKSPQLTTTAEESEPRPKKRLRSRSESEAKESQPSSTDPIPCNQEMDVGDIENQVTTSGNHSSQSNQQKIHVSSEDISYNEATDVMDEQSSNPLDLELKEEPLAHHVDNTDPSHVLIAKTQSKQPEERHVQFADDEKGMKAAAVLTDSAGKGHSKAAALSNLHKIVKSHSALLNQSRTVLPMLSSHSNDSRGVSGHLHEHVESTESKYSKRLHNAQSEKTSIQCKDCLDSEAGNIAGAIREAHQEFY
ncbi:hypothetical protein CVT26_006786 [Gymnopilus dilepis]|uniref:Uncharacterized protein n=1 Tax=Gymnopilus dilepis TaxID=231916 RepID=A0A409Y305_9AGAR|nr:hypothetical protein CVT26_006786 [Gymnopilus dilepis]